MSLINCLPACLSFGCSPSCRQVVRLQVFIGRTNPVTNSSPERFSFGILIPVNRAVGHGDVSMGIEDVLRETDRRLALRRRDAVEVTESALHESSHGVMAVLLEMPDFRSLNILAGVSTGTGVAIAKDGSIDLGPLDFDVTEGYLYKLALMLVAPKCVLNIYFDRDLSCQRYYRPSDVSEHRFRAWAL